MTEKILDQEYNKDKLTFRQKAARVVGAASLAVTCAGFATGCGNPTFSSETHPVTIEQGQGIEAASDTIDGVDRLDDKSQANNYIKDMPENAKTLSDGLQAGETLQAPDSVKP